VPGDIAFSVFSGDKLIGETKKAKIISATTPLVNIIANDVSFPKTEVEANPALTKPFELTLYTSEGSLKSLKVKLSVEASSTLDNFRIQGEEISGSRTDAAIPDAQVKKETTSTHTIYTISLKPSDLTNGRLSTSHQLLTFDASSTFWGERPIDISWEYPAEGTSFKGDKSGTVFMKYPLADGVPAIRITDHYYTIGNTDTKLNMGSSNWYDLPMNGTTINKWHIEYINTGVDAYQLKFRYNGLRLLTEYQLDDITWKITAAGKPDQSGKAEITNVTYHSDLYNYNAPENKIPWTYEINLPAEACLYNDGKLEIIIPTKNGHIFDNSGLTNEYIPAYGDMFFIYSCPNLISAVTKGGGVQNGLSIPNAWNDNTIIFASGKTKPFTVKKGKTLDFEIPLGGISLVKDKVYVELVMRVPDYVSLISSDIFNVLDNSLYTSVLLTPATKSEAGYTIYTWKIESKNGTISYSSFGNKEIRMKLKIADDDPSFNGVDEKTDKITIWTNHSVNGDILQNTSQRHQDFQIICKDDEGIVIDDFSLLRTTLGYEIESSGYAKNSDGNGTPQYVSQDKIRNDLFLVGDAGQLKWETTVLTDAKHLYIPIKTSVAKLLDTNGYFIPGQATVDIQRTGEQDRQENMKYKKNSDTESYLLLSGHDLKVGDKLTVILPFTTHTTNATFAYRTIEATAFVCKDDDPLDPQSTLYGADRVSTSIWSTDMYGGLYTYSKIWSYTSDIEMTNSEYAFYAYLYNRPIPTGGFINESRADKSAYIKNFTLLVPDGYELTKMIIRGAYSIALPLPTGTPKDGGMEYYFDIEKIWTETLPATTATLPKGNSKAGVWDHINPTVKATKSAPRTGVPLRIKATLYNPVTKKEFGSPNYATAATLVYSGSGMSLSLSQSEIIASPGERSVQVNIGNPTTGKVNKDNWLYIESDQPFSNLKLTPIEGTTGSVITVELANQGTDYCWIKMPDVGNEGFKYKMTFDYDGSKTGGNMTVYTTGSFGNTTPWAPNTSAKLDLTATTNIPYISESKTLRIVEPEPYLTGKLTISSSNLVKDQPYDLTASLSSLSSSVEIMNPEMLITIPKGHNYISGSAKIYWNNNGGVALPNAVDNLLLAASSTQPFLFKPKEIVGNDVILDSKEGLATRQEITLTAKFAPDCETEIDGVYFSGKIDGYTLYGDQDKVGNRGTLYYSESLKAPISVTNNFMVDVPVLTSNTLSGLQKETLLTIPIKHSDLTEALSGTEKLLVKLPEALNLKNGDNGVSIDGSLSEISGITIGGITNNAENGIRTISIALDYATMQAATKKDGLIYYQLSLVSSFAGGTNPGDATLLSNPVQKISAYITKNMALPGCESNPKPFPISDQQNTGILFFAYDLPSPTSTSLGATYQVTTTSQGVSGSISIGTEAGTFNGTNTWSVTPVATITGDDETRTVTITPQYNGVTYSPVTTGIKVYPSLIFSAATTAALCNTGTDSQDLSQLLSGDAIDLGSSTVMKYYEGASTTPLNSPTVKPLADTDYYVQSETHDGVLKGEKKKITITVTNPAFITDDLSTTVVYKTVGDASHDLSVTVTGNNLTYQWYSSDLDDTDEKAITGAQGN